MTKNEDFLNLFHIVNCFNKVFTKYKKDNNYFIIKKNNSETPNCVTLHILNVLKVYGYLIGT